MRLVTPPADDRRHRAFTLLEMLVAMAIVLLLAGITLAALTSAARRSEVRETENLLRLLDLAAEEFRMTAGRPLSWGYKDLPPGAEYEVHAYPYTPFVFVMTEVLDTIERPAPVRDILTGIDPDRWHTYEEGVYPPWITSPGEQLALDERFAGRRTILDVWGTPIYPTHPGAPPIPGQPALYLDEDGTLTTYNERVFGSARARRMRFTSAGPDRHFGNRSAQPGTPEHEWTLDNIHSYAVAGP